MSQGHTAEPVVAVERIETASLKLRAAAVLGSVVFFSLLGLLFITAIPYGSAEAWWKALFVCVVFALAILWIVEGYLSEKWIGDGWPVILPILALALFSLLQTIQFGPPGETPGGITVAPWNTISVDPYQSRFFAMQLLALMLVGLFLFRYASTPKRLRIMVNVVIAVAVASAIFGILRQTTQHSTGFGLPLIEPHQGYGQFVNKNHFAYLMEMGFGLALGMILGRGIKREQVLIYLAAILPMWTGLVLCDSRGGLIAMLAQVIIAVLLFDVVRFRESRQSQSRLLRIARSLPMRFALLLVLIFGVVFGTLWLGGDRLATRIEDSRNEFSEEVYALRWGVNRNEIWRATLKMFAANPILGVGMGGYWAAVPQFHDASGKMAPHEAHNEYLELLASGGIVGLAIGVWFVVVVFRGIRENLRSPNRFRRAACFGAVIGIAGVGVHSLVDFGLHMIVNAVVFTTLVVIATSKPQWARSPENV